MANQSKLSRRFEADQTLSPESLCYIETFLRPLIREEVEKTVDSYLKLHQPSPEVGGGPGLVKLKLRLLNKVESVIFTGNNVQLQIALCDVTTNDFNNAVETHPLSSALIEVVVLHGEFSSGHREDDGVHWTVTDFNRSIIVTQREGDRPLLVGTHKTTRLQNGVAFVHNLFFTSNSSRTRTKKFRLGVRIIDKQILADYSRIGEAVSNPIRVKDHRGKVNKKHHPPRGDDELCRLEGITKNGKYEERLSSKGINTVHDFAQALITDRCSLRKMMGRVSGNEWEKMENHVLEYVTMSMNPTFDQSFGQNLVENKEVMEGEAPSNNGQGFSQKPLDDDQVQEYYNTLFEDLVPVLLHGEASTSNTHNYEVEPRSSDQTQVIWECDQSPTSAK